ncbi:MAG: hypothetical protein GKR92_07615 [Gammaproteobacteria bacterium]|nr:MAG: hypothetical protein GKR92_07615 [Gammaproteobacteria bacterium]
MTNATNEHMDARLRVAPRKVRSILLCTSIPETSNHLNWCVEDHIYNNLFAAQGVSQTSCSVFHFIHGGKA